MRSWSRLTAVLCACLMLWTSVCFAESADIQRKQALIDHQVLWAETVGGGDAVNTSVKASDITSKCKFKVSEGDKDHLTKDGVSSTWTIKNVGAWVGIRIPDGEIPGAIRIEWMYDPKGFELIEYDADQNVLRTRTQADTFPNIYTMFTLLPTTRLIQLKMTSTDQSVGRIRVYSEGILPTTVQTWLPPVEKADMMVVSTHQDDEVIFLGGTIPYSDVVCKRPTITVYMTNCTRERRREALECLWEMGSRTYPEFINLKDKRVDTIKEGIALWGGKDNILKELVQRIRRYKPEVIVTQDLNGEYGHNQHKITSRAMSYAIEAAADPAQFPESYQLYGAWQVKKLYLHLYDQNQIRMDWLTPQPACGGLTLLKVAQNGMEKHASQTKYYSVKDGGKYDNALFGLFLTTVGEDVAKNDFFENIPLTASTDYVSQTARAESVSEPTEVADRELPVYDGAALAEESAADVIPIETEAPSTAIPTDAPVVPSPTVVSAPPQTETEQIPMSGIVASLAAIGVAGGAGGLAYYYRSHHRRHRRRRRR